LFEIFLFVLIIGDGCAWDDQKMDALDLDGRTLGENVEPRNFDDELRNFAVDAFDWKTLKRKSTRSILICFASL
jgi:hypothetical protein